MDKKNTKEKILSALIKTESYLKSVVPKETKNEYYSSDEENDEIQEFEKTQKSENNSYKETDFKETYNEEEYETESNYEEANYEEYNYEEEYSELENTIEENFLSEEDENYLKEYDLMEKTTDSEVKIEIEDLQSWEKSGEGETIIKKENKKPISLNNIVIKDNPKKQKNHSKRTNIEDELIIDKNLQSKTKNVETETSEKRNPSVNSIKIKEKSSTKDIESSNEQKPKIKIVDSPSRKTKEKSHNGVKNENFNKSKLDEKNQTKSNQEIDSSPEFTVEFKQMVDSKTENVNLNNDLIEKQSQQEEAQKVKENYEKDIKNIDITFLTHNQFVTTVKNVSKLEDKIYLMGKRIRFLTTVSEKAAEENKILKQKSLSLLSNYENDKKRLSEENEKFKQTAVKKVMSDMIGTIDIFEIALKSKTTDPAMEQWITGFRMIYNNIFNVLEANGVKKIEIKPGDDPDYNLHQTIELVDSDDIPKGKIVDIRQPGYLFNGKLLRVASVTVSNGPKKDKEES